MPSRRCASTYTGVQLHAPPPSSAPGGGRVGRGEHGRSAPTGRQERHEEVGPASRGWGDFTVDGAGAVESGQRGGRATALPRHRAIILSVSWGRMCGVLSSTAAAAGTAYPDSVCTTPTPQPPPPPPSSKWNIRGILGPHRSTSSTPTHLPAACRASASWPRSRRSTARAPPTRSDKPTWPALRGRSIGVGQSSVGRLRAPLPPPPPPSPASSPASSPPSPPSPPPPQPTPPDRTHLRRGRALTDAALAGQH